MKYKLTTLRKNHIGRYYFDYMIEPVLDINHIIHTAEMFMEMRKWCWESFGPSCDYSEYAIAVGNKNFDVNDKWAWLQGIPTRKSRILLNEEAKNWFVLRWT